MRVYSIPRSDGGRLACRFPASVCAALTGQATVALAASVDPPVAAQALLSARNTLLAQAAIAIDTARRVGVTSERCVGMEGAMV